MFFFNNIPFFLFSLILANIFYISFISIFPWLDLSKYFYFLQIIFFILSCFFLKKYKKNFKVEKKSFLYLLIPYLIIICLRWPIYPKVHDDLTYYLTAGEYTKNLWSNPHFFPTYAIYFYNSLPLFYDFFINLFGLRITLLLSLLSLSFWMVSLNLRFKELVKSNSQKLLLDFFFISFPFWPHLMAIHGTFMADFFSLVFILEAFYQFVNKNQDKTFAFLAFLVSGLVKQSPIFYVIPIFLYLTIKNFKKINWFKILILLIFMSSYFYQAYKEISNPLPVCFFNFIFQSPLCGRNIDFSLGIPFGGKNFIEKALWPFIAQFSTRFTEGFVSKYAKFYFTIFLAFPYLFLLIDFLFKRRLFSLLFFLSFIFWSFHIGYARWAIPLIALSWVYISFIFSIKNSFKTKKIFFSIGYFFVIWLSLSSIKTDFGWRPYHNLPFFKKLYFEGWQLIFKDRYSDIKKEFQNEFNDFEAIAIVRGEKAYFYGLMASFYGKNLIEAHNLDHYQKFLNSPKISDRLKEKLRNLLNKNKVLLVVDVMSVPEDYVKDNYFYKNYQCRRLGNFKDIPQIQIASFSSIIKYGCEKNIKNK